MRPNALESAAVRIAAALGVDDCVLIGGLAVGAHGYVRATRDVDFLVRSLDVAIRRLREHRLHAERLRGSFACLRGEIGGVTFDVLPQIVPIQWDRSIPVPLAAGVIHVVPVEDLIRLKLKAGGPRDLMDVAALVVRHPECREGAREIAVAYDLREKLDTWLCDPRLKADLARERRGKRSARVRPKRRGSAGGKQARKRAGRPR